MTSEDDLIDLLVGTKLRDDEIPILLNVFRDLIAENERLRAALASVDGAIRKWDTIMVDKNDVVHHSGIGDMIADDIQKLVAAVLEDK